MYHAYAICLMDCNYFWMNLNKPYWKIASNAQITIPIISTAAITIKVLFTSCFLEGHTTFLSSDLTSLKKLTTLLFFLAFASATTLHLFVKIRKIQLFCFFVQSVFSAKTTILFHFKSIRIVFLVFHGVVVSLFALAACQSDFYSHSKAPPWLFNNAMNISIM